MVPAQPSPASRRTPLTALVLPTAATWSPTPLITHSLSSQGGPGGAGGQPGRAQSSPGMPVWAASTATNQRWCVQDLPMRRWQTLPGGPPVGQNTPEPTRSMWGSGSGAPTPGLEPTLSRGVGDGGDVGVSVGMPIPLRGEANGIVDRWGELQSLDSPAELGPVLGGGRARSKGRGLQQVCWGAGQLAQLENLQQQLHASLLEQQQAASAQQEQQEQGCMHPISGGLGGSALCKLRSLSQCRASRAERVAREASLRAGGWPATEMLMGAGGDGYAGADEAQQHTRLVAQSCSGCIGQSSGGERAGEAAASDASPPGVLQPPGALQPGARSGSEADGPTFHPGATSSAAAVETTVLVCGAGAGRGGAGRADATASAGPLQASASSSLWSKGPVISGIQLLLRGPSPVSPPLNHHTSNTSPSPYGAGRGGPPGSGALGLGGQGGAGVWSGGLVSLRNSVAFRRMLISSMGSRPGTPFLGAHLQAGMVSAMQQMGDSELSGLLDAAR